MVSTLSTTDLARLIQGYRLYAKTEGKSAKTIAIVAISVRYFEEFLPTFSDLQLRKLRRGSFPSARACSESYPCEI